MHTATILSYSFYRSCRFWVFFLFFPVFFALFLKCLWCDKHVFSFISPHFFVIRTKVARIWKGRANWLRTIFDINILSRRQLFDLSFAWNNRLARVCLWKIFFISRLTLVQEPFLCCFWPICHGFIKKNGFNQCEECKKPCSLLLLSIHIHWHWNAFK